MAASGCIHDSPRVAAARPVLFDRAIVLNQHTLALHFSAPGPVSRPLLVYATGDGGWRGKDLAAYRRLVEWGYPTVGFSAPDYLKHLARGAETTTPGQLAADYVAIIEAAKKYLRLKPPTKVILVGISRGAGLSVVAAGQRAVQAEVGGVVAIGLTREEEYVRWHLRRRSHPPGSLGVMLEVYEYLPRLGPLPLAVVQSTHDNYLPADAARPLFGPDTERRQFRAVEARNHSFGGAREEMYDTVQGSLDWIDGLIATTEDRQ